ncbi:hypothetical protein pipiens_016838 [Culex pipiens pipiens]|uniref:Uncharacterized protein n=1 Tax=Culex pipiens pipiens TaxID=38569 RepID=A0ABD1CJN4_CULPP
MLRRYDVEQYLLMMCGNGVTVHRERKVDRTGDGIRCWYEEKIRFAKVPTSSNAGERVSRNKCQACAEHLR